MGETEALARFTSTTTYDDLPGETIGKAKRTIRDFVGVAIAGSQRPPGSTVVDYVDVVSPGSDVTVLGGDTASIEGAALANGISGHTYDFDDTCEHLPYHATTGVFPAALAAVEQSEGSGRDLLSGYVLGVEVGYRIGQCTFPSHYLHGWHYTGTLNTFGAAAATASILNMSADATLSALGIAASCSSGLRKQFGTMTKAYHAGHAAQLGLRSALLAHKGMTADGSILEGDIGYGAMMTPDEYDSSPVLADLGMEWHIMDIGFKPYPGGTINHGAMDALSRILSRENLDSDDVATVRVVLDEVANAVLPYAEPEDPFEAEYSAQFSMATILRKGDYTLDDFEQSYIQAAGTKRQMEKIVLETGLEDDFPMWGARVVVETTGGDEFIEEERYEPKEISDQRLAEKFHACVDPVLGEDRAEQIATSVSKLDEKGGIGKLLEAC